MAVGEDAFSSTAGAPQGTATGGFPSISSTGLESSPDPTHPSSHANNNPSVGDDKTIASAQLEPLDKETSVSTGAEDGAAGSGTGVKGVLDGLAESQPGKTAGDLLNSASALANQAYEAVVGKKE